MPVLVLVITGSRGNVIRCGSNAKLDVVGELVEAELELVETELDGIDELGTTFN